MKTIENFLSSKIEIKIIKFKNKYKMNERILRKKHIEQIESNYQQVKRRFMTLMKDFEMGFEQYVESFHFEKFQREENETIIDNLKRS